MIIWLASYPRSGNTLLRMVLKQCFGIKSYSDELEPNQIWTTTQEKIGHLEYEGNWSNFYSYALASKDTFFIKTHLPPRDYFPCIYIVRNGRMSTLSYFYYYREFLSDIRRNLPELILGCDYYQDWSKHFTDWNPKERQNTLLLKYEELSSNAEAEIEKIAKFIGLSNTKLGTWNNPFKELNNIDPIFFRQGSINWKPDINWTQLIEQLFWKKHQSLMQNLGYAQLAPTVSFIQDQSSFQEQLSSFQDQIIETTSRLLTNQKLLQEAADQRLDIINQLDIEVKQLKGLQG